MINMMEDLSRALSRGLELTPTQHSTLLTLTVSVPNIDIQLSQQTNDVRMAVEAFAASSGESPDTCLRLWAQASDASTRRKLERDNSIDLGRLDGDLARAVRLLLHAEKLAVLQTVLELVQARSSDALGPDRRQYLMRTSNRLLREGLVQSCLKLFQTQLQTLQSLAATQRAVRGPTLEQSLALITQILFFTFYSTQALDEEAQALLSLIRALSTLLTDSAPELSDWRAGLFPALLVLQLAHLAALNQTSILLDRSVDAAPTDKEAGNALVQVAGSRDGLDLHWPSAFARGFACLAHAVLRQPLVETGECPRSDVLWFLQQASTLRAYSYVRVCVLPALQTCFHDDSRLLGFATALLYELFENLAHMFSMPMYQLSERGRALELFPFFPLSQAHLRSRALPPATSFADDIAAADCLDDVMLLYGVLCNARPAFADIFWSGSSFHPFVGRAVELLLLDSSLTAPATKMLAGMALGATENAAAVFSLLRNHLPGRFDWRFIFDCLRQYATQLSSRPASSAPPTAAGKQLSPRDTDGLLAIMDLIAAVACNQHVAESLCQSLEFAPVTALFALLSCAVAPVLKGAILHALASLVYGCPAIVVDVWARLESYRLVPSRSLTGSGDERATGLQLDLETIEAASGQYPVTDGLLSLLLALMETMGDPASLGLGYRFPGVMPYLDHVLQRVLLKAPSRLYLPEGPEGDSQRMRLCAKSMRILLVLLQGYRVHELASLDEAGRFEVERDFANEELEYHLEGIPLRRWPRPKSAGFTLMVLLLDKSRSRLVELVLQLLGEVKAKSLSESRREEARSICATSVELLARVKADFPLTGVGFERCECDGAHWREALLMHIVALLHECCLREEAFLSRTAMRQLSMFLPESARMETVHVQVHSLSSVLAWSQRSAPLSLLANCMSVRILSTTCTPEVAVLVIAVLEHIARAEAREDRLLAGAEELQSFMTCCVNAILISPPAAPGAVLEPRGCYVQPTATRVASCSSKVPLDDPYLEKLDLRTAVMGFLLSTLSPGRLGMAHYLLGLDELVVHAMLSPASTDPLTAGKLLRSPIPGAPMTCLEAILELCLTAADASLLPSCARGLELLFRLATDARTALPVLGLLRKRSVNFLCSLVHRFSSAGLHTASMHSLQCFAWLLRLCAVELHVTKGSLQFSRSQALLQQLFPGDGSQGLFQLVEDSFVSIAPFTATVDSQVAGECLASCSRSLSLSTSVTKGVQGAFGSSVNEPPLKSSFIDVSALESMLAARAAGASMQGLLLKQAEEMNQYSCNTASAAHIALAAREVVQILALNLDSRATDAADSLQVFLSSVVFPLLELLLRAAHMEMAVLDQLAGALLRALSLVAQLHRETSIAIGDYESILGALLRALALRSPHAVTPSAVYRGLLSLSLVQALTLADSGAGQFAEVNQALLEPCVVDLVDSLCRLCLGAATWRTTALTALTLLLAAIEGDEHISLSPALIQTLEVMQTRGFLARLISCIDQSTALADPRGITATLALLTQISTVAGGVAILLEAKTLDTVCALKCFEDLYSRGPFASTEEVVALELMLLQVLRLLRCILGGQKLQATRETALRFIAKNRITVLSLLRLVDASLLRLQLCETVTAVLLLLLTSDSAGDYTGEQVDGVIGDVVMLLAHIGQFPTPRSAKNCRDAWSARVTPKSFAEQQQTQVPGDDSCSVFEARVFDAGLRVLANCATFIRMCCSRTTIGIDFGVIANVFSRCLALAQRESGSAGSDRAWLASSEALVLPAEDCDEEAMQLVLIAEQLLCALYDMLLAASEVERDASWTRTLERVIASCEQAEGHSLIRYIGGRIGELHQLQRGRTIKYY